MYRLTCCVAVLSAAFTGSMGLSRAVQEATPAAGQTATAGDAYKRVYTPGQVLRYRMKGSNTGWEYTIQATDTVKQDAQGGFYEEIGWSDLHSNAPMVLSPASLAFRQTLSLENPAKYMLVPDLGQVQPFVIGPITDLLTFYSDLLLAQQHAVGAAHPNAYVEHRKPNSWADGQHVLLGQDAIDFDLMWEAADLATHTVTLRARHVVPTHPEIALPAAWMKVPVADTPNNWVQVSREGDTYIAEVGKETFDVELCVDTRDGKLISVTMHNPVTAEKRVCQDAALTDCAAAVPAPMLREVSLQLLP